MKISEMVKVLNELMEKEGDLRVTIYEDYMANEGWGYKNEELWSTASAVVDEVLNDDDEVIEKVVLIH